MPWILLTAVDVADPGSTKPFVENLRALRPVARPGARRRIACRPDGCVQPVHVRHGFRRGHLRGLPRGRVAPRRQSRAGRRRSQHVQSAALLFAGRRCADGHDERSRQAVAGAQAPGTAGLRTLRGCRTIRPPGDSRLLRRERSAAPRQVRCAARTDRRHPRRQGAARSRAPDLRLRSPGRVRRHPQLHLHAPAQGGRGRRFRGQHGEHGQARRGGEVPAALVAQGFGRRNQSRPTASNPSVSRPSGASRITTGSNGPSTPTR